jgi:hypothetical protein
MIIESEDLIEKIIKELRAISGEMIIAKSMHSLDDEKQPKDFEELMKLIIKDAKASNEFTIAMTYNEGKYDAYVKMLELLGFNYKND